MSTTYPGLTNTLYPDSHQDIVRLSDIDSATLSKVNIYNNYIAIGDFTSANSYLNDPLNVDLVARVLNAAKYNTLVDTVRALEYHIEDRMQQTLFLSGSTPPTQSNGDIWIQTGITSPTTEDYILGRELYKDKITGIYGTIYRETDASIVRYTDLRTVADTLGDIEANVVVINQGIYNMNADLNSLTTAILYTGGSTYVRNSTIVRIMNLDQSAYIPLETQDLSLYPSAYSASQGEGGQINFYPGNGGTMWTVDITATDGFRIFTNVGSTTSLKIFNNTLNQYCDLSVDGSIYSDFIVQAGSNIKIFTSGVNGVVQSISASMELRAPSANGIYCVNSNNSAPNRCYASEFNTGSLEEWKQDIELCTSVGEIIKNADIYKYRLKSDVEESRDQINYGFVIGENYNTPQELIAANNSAINLYSAIGILWQSAKEQQLIIEQQQNEINILKEMVSTLTA